MILTTVLTAAPAAASKKTILIADDDCDLVQLLCIRCKQAGFDVFRSPDAMHALLGTHRSNPDLIILDVNMPSGNGLSVCEMLATDQHFAHIPVIIMTASPNDEVRQRCKLVGATLVEKCASFWERLEPVIREKLRSATPPVADQSKSRGDAPKPGRKVSLSKSRLKTESEPSEQQRVESPCGVKPDRPKILCIDDDADISKALKLRFEAHGVDVLRAFNGMQGYWTALDMRPDLIILDLHMPEGEGNYIFGRLKMHPLTEKIPVLVLTGQNTPAMRRKMFGLGVDGFLSKPVDFQLLLDHLRQYVTIENLESVPQRDITEPGWSQLLGRGHAGAGQGHTRR